MTKVIDLVRKSCLIRNIERLNKSKITIQDIEDTIKQCPRGTRIFTKDPNVEINQYCLTGDLYKKVNDYNLTYADIADSIGNCTVYNRVEGFGMLNNNTNIILALITAILLYTYWKN